MAIMGEYQCNACGEKFEREKPYGEEFPKKPTCSHCGSEDTKRIITGANINIPQHMKSTGGF